MKYTIVTIAIIIFIVCVVLINIKKKDCKNDEELLKKNIIPLIGVLLSIIVVFITLFAGDIFNNPKSNDDNEPRKYKNCEKRSDTYHKCSWSISEDRCVCKQR